MHLLRPILAALLLAACALPAAAQTIKTLGYNTTNGQVVANTGTNVLTFTNNEIRLSGEFLYIGTNNAFFLSGPSGFTIADTTGSTAMLLWTNQVQFYDPITFNNSTTRSTTRTNLGLGATWLTNTNITNFRTAIGLGAGDTVTFEAVFASGYFEVGGDSNTVNIDQSAGIQFGHAGLAASTRTNLALGATNIVTFAGITNNGDIRINQTTSTNGLLFVFRTNNEPFLGVANLIASNNTTLSNETLFRVGRAEATNQSAQFGFRVVRTNNGGEGFATFSVFGYNALMMIGPSDRSRTNTATNAGIEADIWTITPTNRVMTLRDTNTGALTMHQDLGFGAGLTNTTPNNASNAAVWIRVWVGTNNYRLPLYQ